MRHPESPHSDPALDGERWTVCAGDDVVDLALLLQTTLDLRDLLQLFSNRLRLVLPHSGLCFRYRKDEFSVGRQDGLFSYHHALELPDEPLGEIVINRMEPLTAKELRRFRVCVALLRYPIRNALLYRHAIESAHSDPLTGLGNRRAMDASLARDLELVRRSGMPLSLLMLDLDRFKAVNDQHGHIAGDCLLRSFAQLLLDSVRHSDLVFRYGGEEFGVIMPGTETEGARYLAERIRGRTMQPHHCGGHELHVTVSIGIAEQIEDDTPQDLLNRADQALYTAKKQGRNRIHIAENR